MRCFKTYNYLSPNITYSHEIRLLYLLCLFFLITKHKVEIRRFRTRSIIIAEKLFDVCITEVKSIVSYLVSTPSAEVCKVGALKVEEA